MNFYKGQLSMFRIKCKELFLIAVLSFVGACSSVANAMDRNGFKNWLNDFYAEATNSGISRETLDHFLQNAEFLPKVIELDRKQPGKTKTFAQYQNIVLPQSRIIMARKQYKQNKYLLDEIGTKYGVQPRFIVALWALESDFGRNMGTFNVANSLATLAYEGRRADFFKKELLNVLTISDSEKIPIKNLRGSWAGAMGQTQFMPSSYLQLAVDYDGDGTRDIWNTRSDIFASIANYLAKAGWDNSITWGREVKLEKNFNENLLGKETEKSLDAWRKLGVKNIDGNKLPVRQDIKASIVRVENKKNSRTFLIYSNYKVVLKWNRSLYFATTVGMLADKIKG